MIEPAGRAAPRRRPAPPDLRRLARAVRERPLTAFAALACAIGWIPYLFQAIGVDPSAANQPLGPALAAAIVCACAGRAALREWGRAVLDVRAPATACAIAVAAPIAILAGAVLANHALGAPLPGAAQLAAWTGLADSFALYLVFVGFGEEAGWTAFMAPLLLRRHGLWSAWAIAAAIRTGWHLPLMLGGQLPWTLGLIGNPAFQLLMLWLYRRSGGRWSPAALWHTVLNTLGGGFLFAMVEGADRDRLGALLAAGYALAAALCALDLLLRTGGAPPRHRSAGR